MDGIDFGVRHGSCAVLFLHSLGRVCHRGRILQGRVRVLLLVLLVGAGQIGRSVGVQWSEVGGIRWELGGEGGDIKLGCLVESVTVDGLSSDEMIKGGFRNIS